MSLDELAGPEVGDTSFPYGHNGGIVLENGGVFGQSAVESVALLQPWHESEHVRAQIYTELKGSTEYCYKLEQSWVRLGILLSEFKGKELWRHYNEYQVFDDFISELKERYKRGRTQLYGYMGAAEALLPIMSPEQLERIGISKALELKRAQKKLDGKKLSTELINGALDPTKTASELRGAIGAELHLTEEPKGSWLDLQGFFMLPDERKEFKEAFLATEGLLGLSNTLPDHIRRKEVILAWMREWYGTHAAEFNGVQQPANAEPVLIQPIRKDVDGYTSQIPKDVDGPCSCGGNTDCERCK